MKFRNVDTGKIFDTIEEAQKNFCPNIQMGERHYMEEARTCMLCSIGSTMNGTFVTCDVFIKNYPEEAAKIMGLEIIDEGDDKMETKKSYLAEILGLEEDEVFGVEWNKFIYRIHEGRRQTQSNVKMWFDCSCENDLAYLIENKDKIIKIKCLTEQEKKICDDCGAKWVSMDDVGESVCLWEEKPVSASFCKNYSSGSLIATFRGSKRFPSVKPGDCIEVR